MPLGQSSSYVASLPPVCPPAPSACPAHKAAAPTYVLGEYESEVVGDHCDSKGWSSFCPPSDTSPLNHMMSGSGVGVAVGVAVGVPIDVGLTVGVAVGVDVVPISLHARSDEEVPGTDSNSVASHVSQS